MIERFADASVRKSVETDLRLLEPCDERITDLELYIVRTALSILAHKVGRAVGSMMARETCSVSRGADGAQRVNRRPGGSLMGPRLDAERPA